jgi:hypothetical protein
MTKSDNKQKSLRVAVVVCLVLAGLPLPASLPESTKAVFQVPCKQEKG